MLGVGLTNYALNLTFLSLPNLLFPFFSINPNFHILQLNLASERPDPALVPIKNWSWDNRGYWHQHLSTELSMHHVDIGAGTDSLDWRSYGLLASLSK